MAQDKAMTPPGEPSDNTKTTGQASEDAAQEAKNLEDWLKQLQEKYGSLKGAKFEVRLPPRKQ